MKKHRVKNKITILIITMITALVTLIGVNAVFAGEYDNYTPIVPPSGTEGYSSGFKDYFTVELYKCDKSALDAASSDLEDTYPYKGAEYENETDAQVMHACAVAFNYSVLDFSSYKVNDGASLDPGTLLLLRIRYDYEGTYSSILTSMAFNTYFKSDYLTPVGFYLTDEYDDPFYVTTTRSKDNTKTWLPKAWNKEQYAIQNNNEIFLNLNGDVVSENHSEMVYYGFKVKDDAPGGTTLPFYIMQYPKSDPSYSDLPSNHDSLNDGNGRLYAATNSVTPKVSGGEQSSDNTLGSLTISDADRTYTVDSSTPFVPGSKPEDRTYLFYTSSATSSSIININAVANNSKATIAKVTASLNNDEDSSDRTFISLNNGISVGVNEFQIKVTAENGSYESYIIRIYKLSNDTTLTPPQGYDTGITASGITLHENAGTTINNVEYKNVFTASVDYDKASTTINAYPHHQNATAYSGTGFWEFTESGSTPNVKTVIVQAEDCQHSDVDGCTSANYRIEITRNVASNDATLSDLKVNGTTLTGFTPGEITYNYGNVNNNVNSLTIAATKNDPNATIVSGTGTCPLTVGDNACQVVVKAQDNETTLTYTINVHKLSNDIKLNTMTVTSDPQGTLTPGFNSSYTNVDYTYTYDSTATKVTVTARVNDLGKARIAMADATNGTPTTGYSSVSNQTSAEFNLPDTKAVAIIVTAEDGTVHPYKINLTRTKDTINTLDSLEVKYTDGTVKTATLDPGFTSSEINYSTSIPANVSAVTINVSKSSNYAKVTTIGSQAGTDLNSATISNLDFGNNPIQIVVLNEAGNDKTYTVNVNRQKYSVKTLDALNLGDGFTTTFASGTPSYTHANTLPWTTTTLNLTGTKSEEHETVTAKLTDEDGTDHTITLTDGTENTFSGTVSIPTGTNTITLTATAHDGTHQDYTIAVERTKHDDKSVSGITIDGQVGEINVDETDDSKYYAVVQYSKTSVQPAEVGISIASDATVSKGSAVTGLSTKEEEAKEFTFRVIAEDSTYKDYTIYITRAKNDEAKITKVTLLIEGATLGATASCTIPNGDYTCTIGVPTSTTGFTDMVEKSDGSILSPTDNTHYDMPSTDSTKTIVYSIQAEDMNENHVNTYTITINRTLSSVNTLSDLAVKNSPSGSFATVGSFTPSNNDYTSTQTGTTESVTVKATVTEKGKAIVSRVTVNGTPLASTDITSDIENGEFTFDAALNFGENPVVITVRAENEQTQNYNLKITRQKRTNAQMSTIKYREPDTGDFTLIQGYLANFGTYTLPSVDYEQDSIEFEVVPEDTEYGSAMITSVTGASGVTQTNIANTYTGEGNKYVAVANLSTGTNTIVITGYAHNTDITKTYTLTVYRNKNKDTAISDLTVKGETATLKTGETKVYEVTLPNSATSINTASDISVTLPAGASKSFDPETKDLTTADAGNTITMTVTSEDGDVDTYTLIVYRTKSNVTTLTEATLRITSTVETENNTDVYCRFDSNKECTVNVPTATNGFRLTLTGDALTAGTTDPESPKDYSMSATESTMTIPVVVTAENGEDTDTYTIKINRAKSGNNNLVDISYKVDENAETWTKVNNFVPGTNLYRVEVDGIYDEIYVSATVQDAGKASIKTDLSGSFMLNFGTQNQIDIVVEAEDGSQKTYYLQVTRRHKTDALLETIEVDGIVIATNADGLEEENYTLENVGYNKTSINVYGIKHDKDINSTASVSGNGAIDLSTGPNLITLTVTADDGTTKKYYYLNITRAKNNSTSIDGISLAGVPATRSGNSDIWTVTVPNSVSKANTGNVVVTPTPGATTYDALAQYTLNETELDSQNSTDVTIAITAEDGTTGTKTLRVTREQSDVATLHELTITGGSFNPSFIPDDASPSALTYTVTIPDTYTEITINATPTESHAKITGAGTLQFTGNATFPVHVESEDGTNHVTYYLNVVRSASAVNTLKSITISSGGTVVTDPNYKTYKLVATETGVEGFSSETAAYTITIPGDIDTINIAAEVTDPRARITNADTALGEKTLAVGTRTVTIRVQSESGAALSYILTIVRQPKPFNSLLDLKVDDITIDGFDPDVTEYTLDAVENGKASIVLSGTLEDPDDASVTGFGTCGLTVGANTCVVKVTAQNGTPKEYKINIERKASDENRLSILSVNSYSFDTPYNMDNNEYTVTVKATKTKIGPSDITAIAKDSTATVVKDEEVTLVTNEYVNYNVVVTSASGKSNTYTIRVFKPKSSDATLASVNLTNASLSGYISKDVTNYVLYVPHGATSFTIQGVPTVEGANVVSGNGEYDYPDTNTVKLKVLAEDGTTELEYTFSVEETLSNDATLSTLIVQGYPFTGSITAFSPAITSYSIGDIDYSVEELRIVAAATNITSDIEYYVNGTKQTSNQVIIPPSTGEGSVTVRVIATDGVTKKDYTIRYRKVYSVNNYLAYLASDVGEFTTTFNKNDQNYVLNVGEEVTEVHFTMFTENVNAYMVINGGSPQAGSSTDPYTYNMTGLETGDNPLVIVVHPQDETADGRNYNIIVRKAEPAANSDATLQSLSVEDYPFVSVGGYTTTTFAKDVTNYHIGTLNLKTNKLKVLYETTQSGTTTSILVGGSKVTPDEDGFITIPEVETSNGMITVNIIAPNGKASENYNIRYIKVASSNAFLQSIVVANGTLTQSVSGETTFDREILDYTDTVAEEEMTETITITPEVSTVTIQVGGASGTTYTEFPASHTITGLQAGTKQVPITVTAENGNIAYYYVNIFKEGAGELITSDDDTDGNPIHIVPEEYDGFITSISPNKSPTNIKDQFINDNIKLKIMEKVDDTDNPGQTKFQEIPESKLVGTGMYLKLYINDLEKDSKVLVIKGDVSGDGKINITDVVKTLNQSLGKATVSGAYYEAAEVSGDGKVNITDVVKVLNHSLGKTLLTQHK